jgi:hypothetical protein
MAGVTRMPRTRGGVSGVLLILLGAWGALAPFVGPYFHFAYTPDRAWAYTSGRLWLSIVPGAAALIGGLLVTFASHRAVGIFGALLAALGGAWFIVGSAVTKVVVVNTSISPGTALARSVGSISVARWQFFEGLGFFTGTGLLILFFGALALGRFSVVGVRDAALAQDLDMSQAPAAGAYSAADPAAYPGTDPTRPDLAFPAAGGQYSAASGQYSAADSQYSAADSQYFAAGSDYPSSAPTQTEQIPGEQPRAESAPSAQAPTEQAQPPSDLFPPASPPQNPSASGTGPLRRSGF